MSEMDESLLHQDAHFAFGKNWLDYSDKIDDARINHAVDELRRLTGLLNLEGKTFLDIGCGSGLSALAAMRLGARSLKGVDIDPDSVEASKRTFARFAPSADARFEVASIFDMTPEAWGTFDVVHSWGVLHHTGDMYRAFRCAANLVSPGGYLVTALYRKTPFCGMWRSIKKWYSKASPEGQERARSLYTFLMKTAMRLRGRDFDDYVMGYSMGRGMDYYNDMHDWLGGYPYESIAPDACRQFFAENGFGLAGEFVQKAGRYLPGILGSGCDEFVFRKQ